MNIEKFENYLKNLGIINNNSNNLFFNIFNDISKNSYNKNVNEIFILSVFNYMNFISKDSNLLYNFSINIINNYIKHNNNKNIKFLNSMKHLFYNKFIKI